MTDNDNPIPEESPVGRIERLMRKLTGEDACDGEPGKLAAELAAKTATMLLTVQNLMWANRVSTRCKVGKEPFANPGELSAFVEGVRIVTAGIVMRDRELTCGTIRTILELPDLADKFEGAPWPDKPSGEFPLLREDDFAKLLGSEG